MSRSRNTRVTRCLCFPRVSGDEPAKSALGNLGNTFSPRERG